MSLSTVVSNEPQLELKLDYKKLSIKSAIHKYLLVVTLENVGRIKVDDFKVEVEFPSAFLKTVGYGFEVFERKTATHQLFRKTHLNTPGLETGFYPGEKVEVMELEYTVTDETWWGNTINEMVRAKVYAGNTRPKQIEVPIKSLQCF